mmetsp:Transcript_4322/g.16271  ORF Transcript_4322/g.16271 Transcript_4322/m.16271 type:complete len:96 (+) Transcript_4322:2196-2483(+)
MGIFHKSKSVGYSMAIALFPIQIIETFSRFGPLVSTFKPSNNENSEIFFGVKLVTHVNEFFCQNSADESCCILRTSVIELVSSGFQNSPNTDFQY